MKGCRPDATDSDTGVTATNHFSFSEMSWFIRHPAVCGALRRNDGLGGVSS